MPPKILCVEEDPALLESRCAVLKYSGYDAASAPPRVADAVLRNRKFDLVIFSDLNEYELQALVSLADGADVLVLDVLTLPSELLGMVYENLNNHGRA